MSDMKKWELIVEANSFDGSQTFACEAETKEDALAKFKCGLCEVIEVNIEVVGLDEEPIDIEESTCIQSRLSQDVISRMTEEMAELRGDSDKLSEAIQLLNKIAHPVAAIEAEVKSCGYDINGAQCVALANDAEYLKEIAKQGLAKLNPETMK